MKVIDTLFHGRLVAGTCLWIHLKLQLQLKYLLCSFAVQCVVVGVVADGGTWESHHWGFNEFQV